MPALVLKKNAIFGFQCCSFTIQRSLKRQSGTQTVSGFAHKMCIYARDPWRTPTQHLPPLHFFALFNFSSSSFSLPTGKMYETYTQMQSEMWSSFSAYHALKKSFSMGIPMLTSKACDYIVLFGFKNSSAVQSLVISLDASESTQAQWNCTAFPLTYL